MENAPRPQTTINQLRKQLTDDATPQAKKGNMLKTQGGKAEIEALNYGAAPGAGMWYLPQA